MKTLDEVSFIRPVLVFLLVFYHAFCVYNGMWSEPACFEPNSFYLWLDRFSYSFLLETFVFISGYIWAFQLIVLQRETGLVFLMKRKAIRLLIPSIFFSSLYLLFFNKCGCETIVDYLLYIVSGTGHLWFLPMLFWCFIFAWILFHIKMSEYIKIILVVVIGLFNYLPLPLQLDKTLYFFQFFYLGFILIRFREQIKNHLSKTKVLFFWLAFIILFVLLSVQKDYIRQFLFDDISLIQKAVYYSILSLLTAIYALCGVWAFYTTAVLFCKKKTLNTDYLSIGKYCFGVYIFQQFVLQILYYKTSVPVLLGPIALPWVGFITALLLSFVLSFAVRQTKIGRSFL